MEEEADGYYRCWTYGENEASNEGLWTRQRGSKVGGFVAWQPGLVPATPSIDQFITHLTTFGYCAPRCVILMSQHGRSSYPGSLQRLRLDNLHFDALSLPLSLSQLSSDNRLTGWIDTTYGRISLVDPILNSESIDFPFEFSFRQFVNFKEVLRKLILWLKRFDLSIYSSKTF